MSYIPAPSGSTVLDIALVDLLLTLFTREQLAIFARSMFDVAERGNGSVSLVVRAGRVSFCESTVSQSFKDCTSNTWRKTKRSRRDDC